MKPGDRIRKRGYSHEGTVEAVAELGVRVRWDDGPLMKERPALCHPGELQLIKPDD